MTFTTNSSIRVFGGRLLKLTHQSTSTGTPMNLNLFIPPGASPASPAPLLVWLSGLTCSPDNCAEKGFLHAHAAPLGLAVVFPDTSPRGLDLPGEHDAWDFGSAASFYVDATMEPYRDSYRMESYVARELPARLSEGFAELDAARVSISGHSMGGHGALTLFLRNPGQYRTVSALAPICNPGECPWGRKAFAGYLGEDREEWKRHDATELVKGWKGDLPCLIDVGLGDPFYKKGELLPENLEKAIKDAGISGTTFRYHEDYDHSYFFVSSFAKDHVHHAAKGLGLL